MYQTGKRSRGVLLSVVVVLIEDTRTVSLVDAWRKVTLDAVDVLSVSACELRLEMWYLGLVADGRSKVGPLGTVRNMVHEMVEQRTDAAASRVILKALPLVVRVVSPIRRSQLMGHELSQGEVLEEVQTCAVALRPCLDTAIQA